MYYKTRTSNPQVGGSSPPCRARFFVSGGVLVHLFLNVLVPLYLLIALGYLLGRLYPELETRSVSVFVLNLLAPALVLHSFRTSDITLGSALKVFAVASVVVSGCYLLCFAVEFLLLNGRIKAFEISSVFMNSGYLGLPLIFLMFGDRAFPVAIAFSISMTLLHFTMGIFLLQGSGLFRGVLEVARQPLVWAMVLGYAVKYLYLPSGIEKMLKLTGEATLPVMLIAIGVSLSRISLSKIRLSLLGVLLRFAGGALFSYLGCNLLRCDGLLYPVLFVQSSLPSAVMNYVLCDGFGEDAELAASIIFFSTLLFPLYLPILKLFLPSVP